MNKKILAIATLLYVISYAIIPIIIVNYMTNDNITQAAFFIIMMTSFLAFAINILHSYLYGKNIILPILSIITSLAMLLIFNKSVIVIILLITIFSFLGYFLGNMFTRKN